MTYQELKDIVFKKNLAWQYSENEDKFVVFAVDGVIRYEVTVWKLGQEPDGLDKEENASNLSDFEANISPNANWAIGQRPYPFATGDFDYARDAIIGDCPAGQTTKLYYKIEEDNLYMDGGFLYCGEGFTFGSWASMSIVDHDNLLGYGVDTVLKTWVKKSYPATDGKCEVKTTYAGKPPMGMYLMVTVVNVGATDFKCAINFNLHRAI